MPHRPSRAALPPESPPHDTLPPDTLPPDTLPPDTLPPDTLPHDTLPPDTLPPDTLPPDTLPPETLPLVARAAPPPGVAAPRAHVGRAPPAGPGPDSGQAVRTYRIAGTARLAAALLLDLLFAAAPSVAFFGQVLTPDLSSVVIGLGAFGLGSTLFHALGVPRWGGTPGALITGLRLVTKADGAALGTPRAALRGALSAVETLCFLLGPLWAVWLDPEARTFADRLLGVVPVERQGHRR